ncbi:MAG: AsmA family protein [Parvibaculaceae bacterium]
MSRLIAILVGIVVVLVAVIVAVPLLVPTSVYKEQVVSFVKKQTGRDLTIGGDVGLSFFPRLAVKVDNVDLSNAPWAKDKSMASMKELRAAIKIMPLFSGNIEIDSFILVDPVIHLEVKADGTPNWQFSDSASPAAPAPTENNSTNSKVKDIRLGEISIQNGSATYRNAQSGAALAFEAVNLAVSLPTLDDPMSAKGSVTWNSVPVAFSLAAAKPRAFTDGGPTPVDLMLTSSKVNVAYKGSFQAFDVVQFTGGLDLDVPSVRELAQWVGSPMPKGNGFGPLKVHGEVFGAKDSYSFNNAKISIDGMNAKGKLAVTTGGARPFIKGNLAIDKIDANVYLAADGSAAPAATTPAAPAPAGQSGWSNEPINFSGLKAIDAQIALSTEQLLVNEIKVGPSALDVALSGGVLKVNLSKLALYEGAGSGTMTLNGSSAVPQLQAAFKIAGVKAEPLLTDAAGFKRLSGLTAMSFNVTATGRSQREMVSTLGGNGDVRFTNGAIKGINLGSLMRNVLTAPATGWTSGGSQDTDFSEMGGTFTIASGILTNHDLKLLSPLIRVAGSGTVDIPHQTLNYRVEPKLAATLKGQGGSEAKGIEVPVIVTGPWSQPTFRPDLAAMLRDKDKTIETIKSLKGEGGKQLLNELLGKPAAAPADGSAPAPAKKPSTEDKLKSLFGK